MCVCMINFERKNNMHNLTVFVFSSLFNFIIGERKVQFYLILNYIYIYIEVDDIRVQNESGKVLFMRGKHIKRTIMHHFNNDI